MARAAALAPGNAVVHNNLGGLWLATGDLGQALAAYRRAARLAPADPDPHYNLGLALCRAGDPGAALEAMREAVHRAPRDAALHAELGKLYQQCHAVADAREAFRRALQLQPGCADAACGLASLALVGGRTGLARAWLRRTLRRQPGHPMARLQWARAGAEAGPEDIAATEEALADAADTDVAATLHFALGRMHENAGRAVPALHHYRQGNRRVRPLPGFDPDHLAKQVSAIIEAFPARRLATSPAAGSDSAVPVFIAGPPRSGTTLVEQIIASHPRAASIGERAWLSVALGARGQPDPTTRGPGAAGSDPDEARAVAADYLDRLRADRGGFARIVDKSINNGLYLGLAAILFPRATLIECARDPLDCGLSIYCERFAEGNLPFAYDLDSIGAYLGQHARLMRHWRELLGPRLLRVRYEQLVQDPEPGSRALIAHCGLDWDPACLAFHRGKRPVFTASAWQVRRPIHRRSVGRAAPHRADLEPLRAAYDRALRHGGAGP